MKTQKWQDVYASTRGERPDRKPRTRKDMIAYLANHYRYNTMNSWNNARSYARRVKLHDLKFPDAATSDRAYSLLNSNVAFANVTRIFREFAERYRYEWQIGMNGRSSGYAVLYRGGQKDSEYKSICDNCGQLNYARVEEPATTPEEKLRSYYRTHSSWVPSVYPTQSEVKELGLSDAEVIRIIQDENRQWHGKKPNVTAYNRCGKCGENERHNLDRPIIQTFTYPGRGVDDDTDFTDKDEWDTYSLRQRVDVVWDFDLTVEQALAAFISYCTDHKMVERTVTVHQRVLVAAGLNEPDEDDEWDDDE